MEYILRHIFGSIDFETSICEYILNSVKVGLSSGDVNMGFIFMDNRNREKFFVKLISLYK